jgi:hypothetical protein
MGQEGQKANKGLTSMIKNNTNKPNTKLQKLKKAWDSLKVELAKIKEEMSKVLEDVNDSVKEQTNNDFGMSDFKIQTDTDL